MPPFLPQETDFSCAVACLRMVLAAHGVIAAESELRAMCDCTIFGTAAMELMRAARRFGFSATRKYTLELADLREFAEQGYWPIVYVAIAADVHALVVVAVTETEISVLDPKLGARQLPPTEFQQQWAMMNNLAIVVAHS